jgi:hypothetical protein
MDPRAQVLSADFFRRLFNPVAEIHAANDVRPTARLERSVNDEAGVNRTCFGMFTNSDL